MISFGIVWASQELRKIKSDRTPQVIKNLEIDKGLKDGKIINDLLIFFSFQLLPPPSWHAA